MINCEKGDLYHDSPLCGGLGRIYCEQLLDLEMLLEQKASSDTGDNNTPTNIEDTSKTDHALVVNKTDPSTMLQYMVRLTL